MHVLARCAIEQDQRCAMRAPYSEGNMTNQPAHYPIPLAARLQHFAGSKPVPDTLLEKKKKLPAAVFFVRGKNREDDAGTVQGAIRHNAALGTSLA
jgi:hypothetical protein